MHHPTVFLWWLCSSGEAVKFSPVSAPVFQCLQPWGCGVLEHPALGRALRGASLSKPRFAAHSWALFLLGFVFVIFPFPLPNSQWSCKLRVVCGHGVLVQLFLSEELIVYSWEMLLKVALSMKWEFWPLHLWVLLLFSFKKTCFVIFSLDWQNVPESKWRTAKGLLKFS